MILSEGSNCQNLGQKQDEIASWMNYSKVFLSHLDRNKLMMRYRKTQVHCFLKKGSLVSKFMTVSNVNLSFSLCDFHFRHRILLCTRAWEIGLLLLENNISGTLNFNSHDKFLNVPSSQLTWEPTCCFQLRICENLYLQNKENLYWLRKWKQVQWSYSHSSAVCCKWDNVFADFGQVRSKKLSIGTYISYSVLLGTS